MAWLRDAEAAETVRQRLAPLAGRTASHAFMAPWPIDLALARLCAVLGDLDAARAHLDAAAVIGERCRLVAHRARVELHRAWIEREAGASVEAGPALAAADASPCPGVAREAHLLGLGRP